MNLMPLLFFNLILAIILTVFLVKKIKESQTKKQDLLLLFGVGLFFFPVMYFVFFPH